LPQLADANALVGLETADDAAVYRLDSGSALVQSVDFFSPMVDDPYAFGQIAAANALSDIYAMGGRPLFALNVVGFPRDVLPLEVLHEILRGGAEKAHEAGIAVLGGHTVTDAEPKYGMVVTGLVDPSRITRNRGCTPGDSLVLTKPLGTGILCNAAKKDACPQDALDAAIVSMSRLNRAAALAAGEVLVNACTDVTGFGLVGHLSKMLEVSGLSARLSASALPLLPSARELAEKGFVPGGSKRNRAFYAPHLVLQGATELDAQIACDAQTSGGLLFSVAPDQAAGLSAALHRHGVLAARIGEVASGVAGQVSLAP